jgi:hypothetical protein
MVCKVKIKDIQPAFDNAHRPMWAKHSGGRVITQIESRTLPAQWWKEEYNVVIHDHPHFWPPKWDSAEFESEEALTWFMLKWL